MIDDVLVFDFIGLGTNKRNEIVVITTIRHQHLFQVILHTMSVLWTSKIMAKTNLLRVFGRSGLLLHGQCHQLWGMLVLVQTVIDRTIKILTYPHLLKILDVALSDLSSSSIFISQTRQVN